MLGGLTVSFLALPASNIVEAMRRFGINQDYSKIGFEMLSKKNIIEYLRDLAP